VGVAEANVVCWSGGGGRCGVLVDQFGGGGGGGGQCGVLDGGGCGGRFVMLVDKFGEGGGKAGMGSKEHG